LLWTAEKTNMDGMPGSSTRGTRKRRTERERTELWRRVGAFVAKRREELGLSQGDIIRVLGYKSRNAVSNIEVGIEGLPAKRAYAWADVLEVPRDAFFNFVTGQTERLDVSRAGAASKEERPSTAEADLLASYRKLPPKYQRRLREQASEFETLARMERRGR
jgi:transcriptional regulator with XRE-family HTH domain